MRAWVPTAISMSPRARASFSTVRALPLTEPVSCRRGGGGEHVCQGVWWGGGPEQREVKAGRQAALKPPRPGGVVAQAGSRLGVKR